MEHTGTVEQMPTNVARQITQQPTSALVPYARNSRTHSAEQVAQIAASIQEFGFTNPVLVDDQGGIVAGHGRVMACQLLGLETVPTICVGWLTPDQRRAYVIADNQIALNAGWDLKMLKSELAYLNEAGFDNTLMAFDPEFLKELEGSEAGAGGADSGIYSRNIEAPQYQPADKPPEISELTDETRAHELAMEIRAAKLPKDVRKFLLMAAERHTVFNFRKIADYYASAPAHIQDLMEKSALVIIDFNKAIENGYVVVTRNIMEQYAEDYPEA